MFLSIGVDPDRIGGVSKAENHENLAPSPAEIAAVTPAVVARLAVLLKDGDLLDRLNVLFVLRSHLSLSEAQWSPLLNSQDLVAALCANAGLGLTSTKHPFVHQAMLGSRPARGSANPSFYRIAQHMGVVPASATAQQCFDTVIFLVGVLATSTVAHWIQAATLLADAPRGPQGGPLSSDQAAGRVVAAAVRAGVTAVAADYARPAVVHNCFDGLLVRSARVAGLECLRLLCSNAVHACPVLKPSGHEQLLAAGVAAALEGLVGTTSSRRPADAVFRGYSAQLLSFACSVPASKKEALKAGAMAALCEARIPTRRRWR